MINPFKRKIKQKESNIAKTPANQDYKPTNKWKIFFFLWSVFTISLYSAYTLFVIYNMAQKTFLSKIIVYLLYAYIGIFILLILINLGNRKKLKSKLKNYKSATKFLKYAMQILNFILAVSTAVSALFSTGTIDLKSIIFAVLSLIVTLILILFEIAVIIIRKNIPLIKRNFLEMRDRPEDRDKF